MLMIDHLMECDKAHKSAAKEYRRVLHLTNQNWRPGADNATKFNKEEAKRYIEHLKIVGHSLFIRLYKDDYIIMKLMGDGVIYYYAEGN